MKENADKKQVWTCSTYIFSNDIDVFSTFGAKSSEEDPIGIICSSWHRRSLHRSSTVNKVIRWPLGFITLWTIKAEIIGESWVTVSWVTQMKLVWTKKWQKNIYCIGHSFECIPSQSTFVGIHLGPSLNTQSCIRGHLGSWANTQKKVLGRLWATF